MVRIVPVYKRLVCGTLVFDHDCIVGANSAPQASEPKLPRARKRRMSSNSGDSAIVEVDLPPRLARRVFVADRPLERTKGRKNSLKRVSWKEGREAQFRPVSA